MAMNPKLAPLQKETVTDRVFQALYSAIVTLELLPGSKVSEAEIAKSLGVSRQPVRDAFYRLSELGFLSIRPQRATTISYISEQALQKARFIRTALESECLRAAIEQVTDADIAKLEALLETQAEAVKNAEHLVFHELDNEFHRTICEIAGYPDVWNLIRDQKVHMERIRYLSLASRAQHAFEEHCEILAHIKARDVQAAEVSLRGHLCNISQIMKNVRQSNAEYFESSE